MSVSKGTNSVVAGGRQAGSAGAYRLCCVAPSCLLTHSSHTCVLPPHSPLTPFSLTSLSHTHIYSYPKSGNQDFCLGVALWTLGERGVLVVGPLQHHLTSDPSTSPSLYRVNDEVEVSLDVQLVEGGETKPYE